MCFFGRSHIILSSRSPRTFRYPLFAYHLFKPAWYWQKSERIVWTPAEEPSQRLPLEASNIEIFLPVQAQMLRTCRVPPTGPRKVVRKMCGGLCRDCAKFLRGCTCTSQTIAGERGWLPKLCVCKNFAQLFKADISLSGFWSKSSLENRGLFHGFFRWMFPACFSQWKWPQKVHKKIDQKNPLRKPNTKIHESFQERDVSTLKTCTCEKQILSESL